MARPPRLSPENAKEKILLKLNQGKLEISLHCRYESMPKRNINDADILNVLESGEIKRAPEWSEEHQNWKYRVEGFDIEEDEMTAITVILENILVVTAF
jgi:hypothetical protein